MRAYRRIAMGYALASGGYLVRFALFPSTEIFEIALATIGVGLFLASAGLVAVRRPVGAQFIAGGLVIALLASLVAIPFGYAGDWATIGDVVVALGLLMSAAASAHLVTAPGELTALRIASLRRGAYVTAAGAAVLLLADVTLDPLYLAADLPVVGGFMAAGFAAGALKAGLLRAKQPRAPAA